MLGEHASDYVFVDVDFECFVDLLRDPGAAKLEYKQNKRPFDRSSTDHPPVTKGPAPCHHPEILPHSRRVKIHISLAGLKF